MNSWINLIHLYDNEAGARVAFESACVLTLKARFPNENVHSVRVHQGDSGIDVYVGLLGVEPVDVYQCKYFVNGISDSQKDQIRKSFRSAVENAEFKVKKWCLCLPVDLSVPEAIWFDAWAAKQEAVTPIRIPAIELYKWAEDAGLVKTIFKQRDSLNIAEILALVRGGSNQWASVVEQAEADSFKILLPLVQKHFATLDGRHPHLEMHVLRAESGQRVAACEYVKSVLVGAYKDYEKVWLLNFMSDFTMEPIIYRFMRRYAVLLRAAEEQGHMAELSTADYYSTYRLILSPVLKTLRRTAEWSQANEDNLNRLAQPVP
jgi:hypothetical protein